MIQRAIENKIKDLASKFPVVTLTGVRQCGKTTLLRNVFPDYRYVSLEDPDIREAASADPRGFLNTFDNHIIIDEAQRVPELFSYLQTKVDQTAEPGQYLLSGSHNFLLMDRISQSLAGRTAVLVMTPLSLPELKKAGYPVDDTDEMMLTGFYPRLYDRSISAQDYFPSYIQTYVERDVRLIRNIPDADAFVKFVRLCANRIGQVMNVSALAADAGITVPTANAWLSILGQSYIVYQLNPYHNNFSKRLIKSPKLYFYDTGLALYLLGIEDRDELEHSRLRGALFENLVVTEQRKFRLNSGMQPNAYYWRDSNQNEIDMLTEEKGSLNAYEIKSGETMNQKYLEVIRKMADIMALNPENEYCIYCGKTFNGTKGKFLNYIDWLDS